MKGGKDAVGEIFVNRHAALECTTTKDARAQNHVIDATGDHSRHGGHKGRRVLVIGMNHHHDVSSRSEGLAIAGLLIPAIAVIGVVDEGEHAEALGEQRSLGPCWSRRQES